MAFRWPRPFLLISASARSITIHFVDVNLKVWNVVIHTFIGKLSLFPVPGDYDPRRLGKVVARPHIRPASSRPRRLPDGIPGRTRVRAPVARCSFEPEDAVPWPRQPQGEGARRSTERHLHFDLAAARWSGHQVAFDGESSGTPSVERGSIVIS